MAYAQRAGGERTQDIALGKRGTHMEFERDAAAQPAPNAVDHPAQEGRGLPGVVAAGDS